MKKDYINSIIINQNGDKVQITDIKGKNSKGENLYGYICSKCGKESVGVLNKIKRNKGCKYCKSKQIAASELLTNDLIISSIKKNNSFVYLVDEYKGKNIECQLKCDKHNILFYKKPSSFLYYKSKICPECIKENRKAKNKKYFKNDVMVTLDCMNYQWLNPDEYKDASSLLLLKCKTCNEISKSNISSLVNGRRCKTCRKLNKKSTEDFKNEVFELVGNEYEVSGEYKGNKSHIKMRHNVCGYEWDILPTNFLYNNRRCPKCNNSKGEMEILKYLTNNNIKHIREYSFDDCVYKKRLRFDFYLIDYNICVEFQGKQHYTLVDYMGGKDDFDKRKIRDNIKREYCKLHNIRLIEIPYYQIQNIQIILDKEIFNKTA